MEIQDNIAILTPEEQRVSGYTSPIPARCLDPRRIAQAIKDREIDFFDPELSETGNSVARWRALEADKTIARAMIAQLGGVPPETEIK
jgi:hypothetical protein